MFNSIKTNFLQIKGNIISKDLAGNIFKGNKATYDNNKQILKVLEPAVFKLPKAIKFLQVTLS